MNLALDCKCFYKEGRIQKQKLLFIAGFHCKLNSHMSISLQLDVASFRGNREIISVSRDYTYKRMK